MYHAEDKRRSFLGFSPLFLSLHPFVYKDNQNFGIFHASFEGTDTKDSAGSGGVDIDVLDCLHHAEQLAVLHVIKSNNVSSV